MRSILIVTEVFDIGGMETQIRGEINQLTKLGWQVHLACGKHFRSDLVPPLTSSTTSGLTFSPEATLHDLSITVGILRKLIEIHRIRVVHAHPFTALFPSLIAAQLTRTPFVMSLHGPASLSTSTFYGPYYDFLLNSIILPSAELVVAVSEEVRTLAAPYVREGALIVQHNAVQLNEIPAASQRGSSPDPRWLIVSRLDTFKVVGVREFILFARTAGIPGIAIAGDGPAKELLHAQLANDDLREYVEFMGVRFDIAEHMRHFAGIAGMGRVILEGIANKRPVCLVGYDGVKGILDKVTFAQAAKSNFSGRNLSNISFESFANQLLALESSPVSTDAVKLGTLHDEATVWAKFSNIMDQIKIEVNKPSFAADLYAWIQSYETMDNTAYLLSSAMRQAIGRLLHSNGFSGPVISPLQYQWVTNRNGQIASLNQETTAEYAEYEGQIARLKHAIVERDILIKSMRASSSWLVTAPLRFITRTVRYGILDHDRRRISRELRKLYHRLPPPSKKAIRWIYNLIPGTFYQTVRRSRARTISQRPSIKPAAQQLSLPDYIFWGVIDWHLRHQRPQQLALAVAASGRRVFYVSASLVDKDYAGFDLEPLDIEGRLFQVKLYAKGAPVIYSSAPGIDTTSQLRISIGEILEWANSSKVISLIQHPFWYDIGTVLPNSRVVYDCMDDHGGFDNTAKEMLSLERALFRAADLTVTTSSLLDALVAKYTERRILIRNASDFGHFATQPANVYRDKHQRRIIGYYGAIAEWFDQDLVEAVAKRFLECCVLLIGAVSMPEQKCTK